MSKPHVILGGLGNLGRHLQRTLLGHGKQVRVVDRVSDQAEVASKLVHPTSVEYACHDLGSDNQEPLEQVIRDADTVYSMVTADVLKGTIREMEQTNHLGLQRIVDACHAVGVPKLVHVSSIAVTNHLQNHQQEDESHHLPPWDTYRSYYDITKRKGEELVLEANESDKSDLQTVCIRAGGILGGPTDYNFRETLETANSGKLQTWEGPARDSVSAKDLSRALMQASSKLDTSSSPVAGRALFVSNCKTNGGVPTHVMTEYMAELLGVKVQFIPLPIVYNVIMPATRVGENLLNRVYNVPKEHQKGIPLHMMIEMLKYEMTYDNSLGRRLLDYEPEETWEDALHWIAEEYRQRPRN